MLGFNYCYGEIKFEISCVFGKWIDHY